MVNAEDLPSISMNTVDHAYRSFFGENNVAYIQSVCYRQCLKGDAYTNYTRNYFGKTDQSQKI